MTDDLVVAPGTRLLHIGPQKTGSSALQSAMHEIRPELARQGVHFAGQTDRPRKAFYAIGLPRPNGMGPAPMRFWHRLVAEVEAAGEQRVCVSNEDMARATADQAERIVSELGGPRVQVVAVARRLDRYLPSQWQERVKAGDTCGYDEWLHKVLDDDAPESWDRSNVWFSHDIAALVGRWAPVVGPDRFTLVLNDEQDPRRLPDTFERLLGLTPGTLRPRPELSNRGLSWTETELVRAFNLATEARGWDQATRAQYLKESLVRDLLARLAPTGGPRIPPMPRWAAERVRELGRQRADLVTRLGVQLVGDPTLMLMPDDAPVTERLTVPDIPVDVVGPALLTLIDAGSRPAEATAGPLPEPAAPADRRHRRWGVRLPRGAR